VDPSVRIRFTSPHPKAFPLKLLHLIATTPNVCKSLHVPAQSGSSSVLQRMRRHYDREAYLQLIDAIRTTVPGATLSTDVISGFCGETEEEHQDTISLLKLVKFDFAFMFAYSLREKTHAHRAMVDDVPAEVKNRRLREVIETFHAVLGEKVQCEVGKTKDVLVEGVSKRSQDELVGRSDGNQRVVFRTGGQQVMPGEYVRVMIESANPVTMKGAMVGKA
jgi:tRNA-2-methylthio-N6-dimethylallyladenosine synthase